MVTIGKVRDLTEKFRFEWQIRDFFSLPEEDGKIYNSPPFSIAGEYWSLAIYPNGQPKKKSIGYIGVYLFRNMPGPPVTLSWSLYVGSSDSMYCQVKSFTHDFKKGVERNGYFRYLKRSYLSENKLSLVPADVLTLICVVHYITSTDAAGNTLTAKCSYCNEALVAEWASSHEKKCLDKPIRCPTCSDVVALRKWFDHECKTARIKATEKHVEDMADLIDSGEHSDVTICVKDKEFRLHRSILAIRNPYFNSMFKTEMKEKSTGIVSIDDCEPDIFQSFIYFVYTGKLQTLSSDNVCALYEVADKYQQDQLKSECLCYMKNEISVDNFCDLVVLALKHDETELLQKATELFCTNIKEIIESVNWQSFMREYPTQANELHIKAVDCYTNGCMKCHANCA